MPPKKKTKKLIKLKRRIPASTNINIKIDNSRRTQARKPTENKPKGHINLPITYFSQFQPARTVITDQRPNQGFNTTDMYQSQFKNYFDGKLDDMEKRILEQSEKKNTSPPKPEQKPGAYSRVSDYDDNLIMENRKPKAPPPNKTNIVSNSNLEDNPFIKAGWKPSTFTTDDFDVDYRTTNITTYRPKPQPTIFNAPPINQPQTAIMPIPVAESTELTDDIPVVEDVEELDEDKIADAKIAEREEKTRQKLIDEYEELKLQYGTINEFSDNELKRLKALDTYMKKYTLVYDIDISDNNYKNKLNSVKNWDTGKLNTQTGRMGSRKKKADKN